MGEAAHREPKIAVLDALRRIGRWGVAAEPLPSEERVEEVEMLDTRGVLVPAAVREALRVEARAAPEHLRAKETG